MEVPMYKKEHRFAPWLLKCDVEYLKFVTKFQALLSFSHTILSDWDTWNHLNMLTVICGITMAVCILSGNFRSIQDENNVTARIQTLISFVFAGYISIVINRWDRIRNTTLGALWGALENLNLIVFRLLKTHSTPAFNTSSLHSDGDTTSMEKVVKQGGASVSSKYQDEKPPPSQEVELTDRFIRYSRLIMKLTFMAVQADANLEPLLEMKLLTPREKEWLAAAQVGTRPLIVNVWISEFFDSLHEAGYRVNEITASMIITNVTSLRGGIGATLGAIGTQLPYAYVHLIYWTIQILLVTLAIETGVLLSTDVYYRANGGGFYSPPDDTVSWPASPNVWYMNEFLQITASNIIFALFCEGALKICDKISNPMSAEDSSFSERVYDSFLFNNCQAMRSGFVSYKQLQYEPLNKVNNAGAQTDSTAMAKAILERAVIQIKSASFQDTESVH
eukprot:gene23521-29743_t